jgi:hypothetical protein
MHEGLKDLFSYPLTSALQDRRTRRVAQGVSLKYGAQPYESPNEPSPLSPLEEAILIASTSVTGAVMHDGPTRKPDGTPELGTMFMEVVGRAASSADNAQATSFFMINDEGVWLIERPRGRDALELFTQIPPRWEDRTEDDWISFANASSARSTTGASRSRRSSGRTSWAGTASTPTRPARRAFCPSWTTRASTSTCC